MFIKDKLLSLKNKSFPYYSFSQYLRKYPFPVFKASIDAGFICPNMDGSKGVGGCTFCNNASFSPAFRVRKEEITEQLNANIERILRVRKKAALKDPHFIAYFQAFSGTYGPAHTLKEWYDEALKHPKVIGLSVGTRADCLSDEVLSLFEELASHHPEIWIEIGVESTHNPTLNLINRGHLFEEVVVAMKRLKKIPQLKICLHLIHGLPFETPQMMLTSVERVNALKPDAVKFHHLEIIKDTVMQQQYEKDPFPLLSLPEYFEILGKSLILLDKDIVIQRLFSASPKDFLIAPHYTETNIQQLFLDYLYQNQIFQGSHHL
jgi:radical SAM protein (TIGR01212 family)